MKPARPLRTFGAAFALVGFMNAPLQCGSKHGPDTRVEETGDALWALALDFRAKGNEDAAKQTMRYLVEKYPSNRHVPAARAELEGAPPKADGGT